MSRALKIGAGSEKLDLTAFGLSQRVIGSALDPANPPAWYVTGYSKSNMKVFSYAGDDVGAGFYALEAAFDPQVPDTYFRGYRFATWWDKDKQLRMVRCPYILIRETAVAAKNLTKDTVQPLLPAPGGHCDLVRFPDMSLSNQPRTSNVQ